MTAPASPTPPELSLLKTLHHPSTGPSRSWQSIAHPDPSAPLLATASADKTVDIWNLRDYSLISTISGGHKRSVRAVAWKDYGRTNSSVSKASRKPVVLGTGSFDANVGIWIWNDDRRGARFRDNDKPRQDGREEATGEQTDTGMGAGDDTEIDLTRDGDGEEEDDEEWHFSTLLTGPDSEIKSIEFSPPHYATNLLATCSRDKSVWIWEEVEPEEWETIAVLSEHTGDVKCVSWCAGAKRGNGNGRKTKRRRLLNGESESDGDVEMGNGNANVASSAQQQEDDGEDEIIGSRDVLASGSYDDTIRLWRDVEEEGDWICVSVIEGHRGTVWHVKWEGYINYGALDSSRVSSGSGQDSETAIAEFEADWQPRIVSCSDDMTVRIWRRELSEAEKAKRAQARIANSNSNSAAAPMGFASSRLPSVIRPMSSMERWVEDVVLPQVHVRSVYAVDWSSRTGLVVSCGGDGAIVVYKEVVDLVDTDADADVVMNGTAAATTTTTTMDAAHSTGQQEENGNGNGNGSQPYKVHKMKWVVVALIEAAHDEYEVNHVCWAERRDKDKRYDGEEVIISTGDEGHVRVWTLPDGLMG